MLRHWKSWLTIFTMSEDDNEGVFGPPPETGNAHRMSQQMLGHGPLRYKPTENTRRGWDLSDADVKDIMERDGLATRDAVDQRPGRRLHRAPARLLPHR